MAVLSKSRPLGSNPDMTKWPTLQLNGQHTLARQNKSVCILHSLNIELDLQSVFGVLCTGVLIGWDPAIGQPSGQDRRHLFVTRTLYVNSIFDPTAHVGTYV